jgi:hypothetical protein
MRGARIDEGVSPDGGTMVCRVTQKLSRDSIAILAGLILVLVLVGCKRSAAPITTARMERAVSSDLSKTIGESSRLLMDFLEKPTAAYHFSYKAQENINMKYPMDKSAKPEVGPVEVQVDGSPDEINLASVRGNKKTEHKAKKGDELAWSMAQLAIVGPVGNVGIVLAFGQLAARPTGSETVGGAPADRYDFDTAGAMGANKAAFEIARSMISNLQSTKGTIWIDKASRRLTKFNIDTDLADKVGNAWKEHYEGELTLK